MVKKMISPFYLDFKKNPYSYILIPIAIVQLLTYLATASDNFIPAIMFAIILVLVGKYTNDATYKLGIPIIVTFVLIRYDILKQNFWEGIENKDDDDDVAKSQNTNRDKDSNEEDKKVEVHDKEVEEDKEVQDKKVEKDKDVQDKKVEEDKDEEEDDGDGRAGFTNNDNALNNTMDKIDNTLDRLERSYDRIMKVGSKLGMSKEMNSLSKSLDITGILNQKKKLA